jgi:protein deglycase
MTAPSVLLFLHQGFEEIEAVTPLDLLRRAGAAVTIVSCHPERLVTGKCGVTLQADTTLDELPDQEWDLLVVPGGPAVNQGLRQEPRVRQRLQAQAAAERWIGAICAAPLVLLDAGLLDGKRYTAHPSAWKELPAAQPEAVVHDGCLITSQGAGTALPFALALVEAVAGAQVAQNVSDSICAIETSKKSNGR